MSDAKRTLYFLSWQKTVLAGVMFVAACGVIANLYRLKQLDPGRPDPRIAYAILGVVAILSFLSLMRGGVTLDMDSRSLTR